MLPLGGLVKSDGNDLHITDISKLCPFFSGNPSIFTINYSLRGKCHMTFSVLQAAMIICIY